MNIAKKRTTLATLAGILLAGSALYLALGDRIPQSALASAADSSAIIQGMIGKATHAQQKQLAPLLAQLEAEETPDEAVLEQARKVKQAIDKDLQLAFNLMNAGGSGDSGWYFSAMNIQRSMGQRLDTLAAKLASSEAAPPAVESGEAPAAPEEGTEPPAPAGE